MKRKATKALTVKRAGVSVLIRPTLKAGKTYFVADYWVNGGRKLVWRSTLEDAKKAANEAIDRIQDGETEALEISRTDRDLFLRTVAAKGDIAIPLDLLVSEAAEATRLLSGRATLIEAAKDWLKRHDVPVPLKTIADACKDCLKSAESDGKSQRRRQQLSAVFDKFEEDHNLMVTQISTAHVSQWLAGLGLKERTRRNYRDAIGYLNRWCVLRGYLARGTNWLEGVQQYSARKHGEIEIYTPEELKALLAKADAGILPFIAVQAFAGLRHAEAARLDWQEVDLADGFIEVRAVKSKTGERRLVPIQPNLKTWLEPHRKEKGPLCEYANTTKQILKVAAEAGVEWKHNGLRHSFISYRVAACADIPRVADEAGNSPQIIRHHYLRRVKPAEAEKWFAITEEA